MVLGEAKDIKIVFTDIDGTFFSHSAHRVPPSAIQAAPKLQGRLDGGRGDAVGRMGKESPIDIRENDFDVLRFAQNHWPIL